MTYSVFTRKTAIFMAITLLLFISLSTNVFATDYTIQKSETIYIPEGGDGVFTITLPKDADVFESDSTITVAEGTDAYFATTIIGNIGGDTSDMAMDCGYGRIYGEYCTSYNHLGRVGGLGGPSNERSIAQEFIASKPTIDEVHVLLVKRSDTGTANIEIIGANPDGTPDISNILGATTMDFSTYTDPLNLEDQRDTEAWYTIEFNPPVNLNIGDHYFLLIRDANGVDMGAVSQYYSPLNNYGILEFMPLTYTIDWHWIHDLMPIQDPIQ